jgi:threonylcarbamoyladenosine tRNA methylthiotransferase MtaB
MSIGTDIIVGFPTEEESHFNNMMTFLDSQPFTYLHVFPFSVRPGTLAANLMPQVSDSLKRQRVSRARELSMRMKAAFWEENIDLEHEMLVETVNENGIIGTTSNYIKVFIPFNASITLGKLVRIRITGVGKEYATGLPIINLQPPDK